jgi:hypothetical protein
MSEPKTLLPTKPLLAETAAVTRMCASWASVSSTSDPTLFRVTMCCVGTSTPGGYFHGMVAKAGELNLARTVWGLRHAAAPNPNRPAVRAGGSAFVTILELIPSLASGMNAWFRRLCRRHCRISAESYSRDRSPVGLPRSGSDPR